MSFTFSAIFLLITYIYLHHSEILFSAREQRVKIVFENELIQSAGWQDDFVKNHPRW
jgi:hypothetical protein